MCADRGRSSSKAPGPILLTGASGTVGSLLRAPLARLGPVRLADVVPSSADAEESVVIGDLADPQVAERAVTGTAAIVHLAAYPRPDAPWDVLAHANLATTIALLDAAARHDVRRVVLASSVHAAGGYGDPGEWPVDPDWPARPCCRYGVSKAASELLLQEHATRHPAVAAVALRFGLVAPRPRWRQEIRGWTPTSDVGPLVTGSLRVPSGYQVHFAVTASDRPRYRTDGARVQLGYLSELGKHFAGALSDAPPAYAENCQLWRHPALDGWLGR